MARGSSTSTKPQSQGNTPPHNDRPREGLDGRAQRSRVNRDCTALLGSLAGAQRDARSATATNHEGATKGQQRERAGSWHDFIRVGEAHRAAELEAEVGPVDIRQDGSVRRPENVPLNKAVLPTDELNAARSATTPEIGTSRRI